MERNPAVYIMASGFHGTIYTGVTSNLLQRIYQHRTGATRGFTAEYEIKRLVWFEMQGDMEQAIRREKQLKNWHRQWKVELIEAGNPLWRDLAEDLGFEPLTKKVDHGSSPGWRLTDLRERTHPRHAGLDPASTYFSACSPRRWTPDQVRGDGPGKGLSRGIYTSSFRT